MPVLLRLDAATHAIVSETVVEGVAQTTAPLLALDAQHAATLVSGQYLARIGQVSTTLFDPIA
jgi:hypothetical protein